MGKVAELKQELENKLIDKPDKKSVKKAAGGKVLTYDQYKEAWEKNSALVTAKFIALLKSKLGRQLKDADVQKAYLPASIEAFFDPLIKVHTFKHTRGDVVTGYTNESGQVVPFDRLVHFLSAQVDYSAIFNKRLECWTNMYVKAIKNNDATWLDQYKREKKVDYPHS